MRIYIKSLIFFLSFFAFWGDIKCQVQPANGDTLNFTQVLFEFPWETQAAKYKVSVWPKGMPGKKITKETGINKTIISGLSFSSYYVWTYEALDAKGKSIKTSDEKFFFTVKSEWVDSSVYRYRVIKNLIKKRNDGIVFFDYGRVAVDRTGKPVWVLPNLPYLGSGTIRCISATPSGNILLMSENICAIEIGINGDLVWKAPNDGIVSGEKNEFYHHDFKKLDNGNYMILGNCHVKKYVPGKRDSVTITYGTIIEYSKQGKVLWSWNSKNYFTDEYILLNKTGNENNDRDMHMNAFCTDGKYVYAGFRNISNIIKIEKLTNKVVASYGQGYHASAHYENKFFKLQHDVCILKDGNMAVVNNDSVSKPNAYSSLLVFSEPNEKNPVSKKIFELSFNYDTLTNGKSLRSGNLYEMKNGNLLVNMGTINRAFEVSRKKEIVWDMFAEKYDATKTSWTPFSQYRLSFASSLYPYCFTAKAKLTPVKGDVVTVEGEIWNVGTETDSYIIDITQNNALVAGLDKIPQVAPNKSFKFNIKVPQSKITGQLKVMIHSSSGRMQEIPLD